MAQDIKIESHCNLNHEFITCMVTDKSIIGCAYCTHCNIEALTKLAQTK